MKHKLIVEMIADDENQIGEYSRLLMREYNFIVSFEEPINGVRSIDEVIPTDDNPKITLGSYTIQQMPHNPLKVWVEDTTTGEAGEFDKVALDYVIYKFYKGNF